MKVEIFTAETWSGLQAQRMYIDGRCVCCVNPLCECPEDAIIGRDLVSCSEIYGLMEQAYQAGKRGECLELHTEHKDWEDL